MGKDIKIDAIINAQLRELATSVDTNDNKKIDKKKEFKALAEKLANVTDETLKSTQEYKNLLGWAGGTKKERKAAKKSFEAQQVAVAEDKFRDKIADMETVTKKNGEQELLDSKKEIRRELRKEAETDFDKKAIQNLKTERKIAARHNKYTARYNGYDKQTGIYAEEANKGLASVTEKELKGLKENFGQKFKAKDYNILKVLEGSGYLETIKNDDGTYDFRELADAVFEGTGYDYQVNRSKQYDVRELDCIKSNIVELLNDELGYTTRNDKGERVIVDEQKMFHKEELTDAQVKNLVDFIGLKYEPREHKVVDALKNTIPGALIAGLAGGISSYFASPEVYQHQYVSMDVDINTATQILENMETSSGKVTTETLNDGRIRILVDQKQFVDRAFSEAITNGLISAGIGAALSFALGLAIGKDKDFEQACLSLTKYKSNNAETTKTKFAENLDAKKANVLSSTLDAYVAKYGEYKGMAQFWADLEEIAGKGSILNCEEVKGARMYQERVKKPAEPTQPVQPVQQQKQTIQPIKPQEAPSCKVETEQELKLDGKEGRPNSLNYGWHEIIMMYYSDCLANHSEKEIRFALRKFNGVPNNCTYVPKGIVLPYDLFGDGSCFRTEKKDVQKGKYKQSTTKPKTVQTPQGWVGYISCPNADGTVSRKRVTGTYPTKEAAEKAAQDAM